MFEIWLAILINFNDMDLEGPLLMQKEVSITSCKRTKKTFEELYGPMDQLICIKFNVDEVAI